MMYHKGDIVLYFHELCEYIGYEELEDDNYHRLLTYNKGEILVSACYGPTPIKDCDRYINIKNDWNRDKQRHIDSTETVVIFMKNFLSIFKTDIIKPVYYSEGNIIIWDGTDITEQSVIDSLRPDVYKLMHDELYQETILKYINKKINDYEPDWC